MSADTIADRCDDLAIRAARLKNDAEFRASLALSRGELTMTHVSLHSAKLAIARAKEAIDAVCADADRFVKETA